MKQWKHQCELQLLVCEPNLLRPDRVTVGFVLRDSNPEAPRVEVRIAKDFRAVKCIHPEADIEAIEGTLLELKPLLENVTDIEKHLQNLPSDLPFDLALLPKGAVLTESIEAELPVLEEQFLTRLSGDDDGITPRNLEHGRAYLVRRMQEAFRLYGVLRFLQPDIPVAPHTFKGDPLTIDFGYLDKQRKTFRAFHATSVLTGLDKTRIVALSWPRFQQGFLESQQQESELLAIVEDERFQQSQQAKDARGWLEEAGIRVEPVSAMMTLAAEVKQNLQI